MGVAYNRDTPFSGLVGFGDFGFYLKHDVVISSHIKVWAITVHAWLNEPTRDSSSSCTLFAWSIRLCLS